MRRGIVYTETTIHAAPASFVADAPYQIAIVEVEGAGRNTVRIRGVHVAIGDIVTEVESQAEIPFFEKYETR